MSSGSGDSAHLQDGGDGQDDRGKDKVDAKTSGDRKGDKESLKKLPWFWPYTTRDEADRRLASQPDGTFLVRDCSVPGDYTLTVRAAGSNRCVRIYSHQNGYSLSPAEADTPFSSVQDLVEFYRHHSLAAFNKRLDVHLSHPLAKPTSAGCNQYGVFKELYDLSQDQLSTHTRLSVLLHQRSQLNQRVKLFEMTLPALRVVQQMYFDSMQLQEDWTPRPPESSGTRGEDAELSSDVEESERLKADGGGGAESEDDGADYRLSKDEEKSFTVNTRLLLSRHSELSDKLHSCKSHYDVDSVKLADLDAELKHVELSVFHMKRRQEELTRLMIDSGCQKEYLSQVLESRVATREFDRSTWLRECSREQALAQLEGLPHGAFLVRHKDRRHLPYVLSIVVSRESEPRTVQHCYIVRPHGRGYGFNPALAVFESVDQLVLRHRHVSLKHYFRHLDVMLTFPVGCQELLHRSASESDKESVVVKEGEYANAAAIQEAMEDNVYEPVEIPGQHDLSGEKFPRIGGDHSSGDLSAANIHSSSVAAAQDPRKDEDASVDSSDLVKRHKYETIGKPGTTVGYSGSGGSRGRMKKHKYEPVGPPRTNTEDVQTPKDCESVKGHKYETVFAGNTVETVCVDSVENGGQQSEVNVYELVVNPSRQSTV